MSMIWLAAEHAHPSLADLGFWEWVAVVGALAVLAWVVWRATMLTLRPGEEQADHIKRIILRDPPIVEVSVGAAIPDAEGRGP